MRATAAVTACRGAEAGAKASTTCRWTCSINSVSYIERIGGTWSGAGPVRQSSEGRHEVVGPGPTLSDAQCGAPRGAHQHAGGVQERVAQSLGLGPGPLAIEAESLQPDQKISGDEDQGQPGRVDGEAGRWQVGQSGVLGVADPTFAASAAAIERVEEADVV